MEKLAISVQEMSERLGLSRPKCFQLLYMEKGVPYIRVGKRVLVPVKSLEEYINSTGSNTNN